MKTQRVLEVFICALLVLFLLVGCSPSQETGEHDSSLSTPQEQTGQQEESDNLEDPLPEPTPDEGDSSQGTESSSQGGSQDASQESTPSSEHSQEATHWALDWNKVAQSMLLLVNDLRHQEGVAALTYDDTLNQASQQRVQEMITSQRFDHSRPDGSAFYTILQEYGYTYQAAGENLLWYEPYGALSEEELAQKMFQLWLNSPGHKKNMVDASYTVMGFAAQKEGDRYYGLQIFASPQE